MAKKSKQTATPTLESEPLVLSPAEWAPLVAQGEMA
jgi:hypothetical protein